MYLDAFRVGNMSLCTEHIPKKIRTVVAVSKVNCTHPVREELLERLLGDRLHESSLPKTPCV